MTLLRAPEGIPAIRNVRVAETQIFPHACSRERGEQSRVFITIESRGRGTPRTQNREVCRNFRIVV